MRAVSAPLPTTLWQCLRHSALLLSFSLASFALPAQTVDALHTIAENWLNASVRAAHLHTPGVQRIETSVGALDPRLTLAACSKVQAYTPAATQLWGKTRVGLRCVQGASAWNITLPAHVKVFGLAWVVQQPISAGSTLTSSQLVQSEVEWTQHASPIVQDSTPWVGKIAARLLDVGQTLRRDMLKPEQVFQAGASLRVIVRGVGFEISSDAVALSFGVIGEPARIRMESGRIASATVLNTKTVQIDL